MELSGEVLSGYFFDGVPGPQFVSHEAFRMLQEPQPKTLSTGSMRPTLHLSAAWDFRRSGLPSRIASTHLVYHGTRLVMVSKRSGKNLEIMVRPDDQHMAEYFKLFKDLLSREFNPLQKIVIETINGESAAQSPFAAALRQFGFRSARSALELWREY